ncbi:unnamed protein product, partial [Ixodes persulcatus]
RNLLGLVPHLLGFVPVRAEVVARRVSVFRLAEVLEQTEPVHLVPAQQPLSRSGSQPRPVVLPEGHGGARHQLLVRATETMSNFAGGARGDRFGASSSRSRRKPLERQTSWTTQQLPRNKFSASFNS